MYEQVRCHGGYSGAVPPKICCAQKNFFKHVIKTKIMYPPQTLNPGYGPVEARKAETLALTIAAK